MFLKNWVLVSCGTTLLNAPFSTLSTVQGQPISQKDFVDNFSKGMTRELKRLTLLNIPLLRREGGRLDLKNPEILGALKTLKTKSLSESCTKLRSYFSKNFSNTLDAALAELDALELLKQPIRNKIDHVGQAESAK